MSQLQNKQDGGKDRKTKPKGKKQTPMHEKMNSTQKRKGKTAIHSADGEFIGRKSGLAGRPFNFQEHFDRFKSVVARKRGLDQRLQDSKLPVWDHLAKVHSTQTTVDGVTTGSGKLRFQAYADWKKKRPVRESAQPVWKTCEHVWPQGFELLVLKEKKAIVACKKCMLQDIDYKIDVKETSSDDLNTMYEAVCQEFEAARAMIRDGLGNKPFLFKLVYDQGYLTSAANTALQAVQRCRPSDDNVDFGFAQAIFDEYKMTHGEYTWFMNRSASGNGSAVPAAAVAYDPMDATAVTKVPNALRYAQHQGPVQMNEAGTTPQQMNPTGFYHFKFKCPSGPQYEYGAVTSLGTGVWTDTQVTAVDYGYIKATAAALGAGITTQVAAYLSMWTEFRCAV